ncbi:MAG: 23S rRNA (guanosine(2251)-2'-O)-methyltransferase RlmB, partial [Bacteroidetes bacterium RIFOXYC2_FULL_40_12]
EPFILALDEITDVRNFGAIVRSAECAGVDVIVIPEKGSARIGSDAVKTSAGALYKLPVCRVTSLKKALQYAQQSGIKVFGATEKTSEVYYRQNLTGPICLVMGSEDIGLSVEVIRTCDHLIKIPILGQIESLNVSAAASVLLYEVVRQRQGV